jgi:hypothetical protein
MIRYLTPFVFAVVASTAFARTTPRAEPTAARELTSTHASMRPVVTLDNVIHIGETVIAGRRPVAPRRVWTCGPMHENAIGGFNRDCEWR